MRENDPQNRLNQPADKLGLLRVPRNLELQPEKKIEQIEDQPSQPDWFVKLTRNFAETAEVASELSEPVAEAYPVQGEPEAVTVAPSTVAEITHHDPVEFFRAKVVNIERVRAQKELEQNLARLKAREDDILGHREFAKNNRYSSARVVDFLMGKKELVDSLYYNDYFASVSPFSQTEITDEDLISLESKAAIERTKVFGEPVDGVRREFCLLGDGTWFYHQSDGEQDVSIHYQRDEQGVLRRDNESHAYLGADEMKNFIAATKAYHQGVSAEVYRRRPVDVNGDGIIDAGERARAA